MNALYRMLLHSLGHERPDDGHRLPHHAPPPAKDWPSLENTSSRQRRRASDVVRWHADGQRDAWNRTKR